MSLSSALIGSSTVIRHVQHLVSKMAEVDSAVLITGESGTGKEVIARTIHDKSSRSSGPFVSLNCGAINEDHIEGELFGHEIPGNDSGHRSREGRFVFANNGTLYLEDVCKLSPKIQTALLKFLQENTISPVGSSAPKTVSTRLICSCTPQLEQFVRDRTFREDLFYRLMSFAVYVPPLRERREDIPPLVEFFVNKLNQAKNKTISGASADAMTALLQHSWPNNMRELENLLERIIVLKNSGSIEVSDLPPRLRNLVTDNIDAFYDRHNPASGSNNSVPGSHGNMAMQAQGNMNSPHMHSHQMQGSNPGSHSAHYGSQGNLGQGQNAGNHVNQNGLPHGSQHVSKQSNNQAAGRGMGQLGGHNSTMPAQQSGFSGSAAQRASAQAPSHFSGVGSNSSSMNSGGMNSHISQNMAGSQNAGMHSPQQQRFGNQGMGSNGVGSNMGSHMQGNMAPGYPNSAPRQNTMQGYNQQGYMQPPYSPQGNMGYGNLGNNFNQGYTPAMGGSFPSMPMQSGFEEGGEIDQFIKKEIDLGGGIDFYRVVEEFENRLIAEALRRTNHNKNRAAQLLSMNRTTLVEKLKKRAASTSVKPEANKVKRGSAFTIFDGLGKEDSDFDAVDYISAPSTDSFTDID